MTERFEALANRDNETDKYKVCPIIEQRKRGYKDAILLLPLSYSMNGTFYMLHSPASHLLILTSFCLSHQIYTSIGMPPEILYVPKYSNKSKIYVLRRVGYYDKHIRIICGGSFVEKRSEGELP